MSLRFESFSFEKDLPAQRELFLDAFPETKDTPASEDAHYNWKFQTFPGEIPSLEYAAWDENRLVGYYAAIPYRYRVFGKDRTIGMVCDVMTHSSMRGKGVFTKLGAYALENLTASGLDFTTGYPIRPEVIPGHLKVGWKIALELPLYLKVLRTEAILRERNLGFMAPVMNFAVDLYNKFARSTLDPSYDARVMSIEELCSLFEYQVFLTSWRDSLPISLEKSPDFLRWRLGAPHSSYKAITIFHEERVVAVAIVRATVLKGIPTLAVVDLMALHREYDCLGLLHREIEKLALELKCETISTMISKHWSSHYRFRTNGFIRTPFVFKLILRSLKTELPPEAFLEDAWHLMWIDSDDV